MHETQALRGTTARKREIAVRKQASLDCTEASMDRKHPGLDEHPAWTSTWTWS